MNTIFHNRTVPDVVYANDGTKYYPCKYCCRAFAHKRYLTLHMRACIKTRLNKQLQLESLTKIRIKEETKSEVAHEIRTANNHKVPLKIKSEVIDLTNQELPNNNNNNYSITKRLKPTMIPKRTKLRDIQKCKICAMAFATVEELIIHAKIEHNQRKNSEKRIFPPTELEYFYTIFLKSNRTNCPICDKPIGNKLNWRRHLYTHSSVKKYECKICKKPFSRSDHCKYHEQRHKIKLEMMNEDDS